LVGVRYGLHFLTNPTADDPLSEADKIRLTPKKKEVTITIWREGVSSKKEQKEKNKKKGSGGLTLPAAVQESATGRSGTSTRQSSQMAENQAQSNQALLTALDNIFATSLDDRMIDSMPACWKLYFQAAAAKRDYRPADPSILRQSAVDQKARLLTSFVPPSDEFAEHAGVTGAAIYHVVVSTSGKPSQVVISHPIGFGLDEKTVDSIQKISFQPAIKNGQPVPVLLDLVVEFRLLSKRTGEPSDTAKTIVAVPETAPLPGPYSVNQPVAKPQ
jgi:hypothetical protein